ncbi:MAG: acetyltransferase [Candidatus Acetothermia bacterium]|jgi:sugar O-acyltransferase (sialic acid O-acetyltransferase NeuD family)|nr:acetyltransferase [Candidatus Acetothermia bacterium]MDH7505852.1 acetyltransferase [Candidatus Acetothermia bacterium]
MADKVLIYGASGHGKVIIDIMEREGRYKIVGLLDDNPAVQGQTFFGYPVLGGFELLNEGAYHDCQLILAIGDNLARKRLWERIRPLGYKLACAIHPSAQLARDVTLGPGTVVMAAVAINSGSRIGENAIINTGATVDHDCVIGDYVHISPGAHLAGNVYVGELSHIGLGASVIQGIKIGRNAIIGAGAVVLEDIPDNVTAVGVPAKVIKGHADL